MRNYLSNTVLNSWGWKGTPPTEFPKASATLKIVLRTWSWEGGVLFKILRRKTATKLKN